MPIHLDDKRLARKLLAGDECAFARFFDDYFSRLYRFALTRLSGDEEAAREVVQSAMTKAIRRIHSYRGESALFTWLCVICRNESIDWQRRNASYRRHVVLTEDRPEIQAAIQIDGRSQPRSWDHRHALQAGLSWRSDPWEVGVAVNAHTGWPTTVLTAEYDPEEDEFLAMPGERNAEKYNTYLTLDFRVSREFAVRKGRLSAFLEVSNATNRDNECCVDYDLEDEVGPPVIDRSPDHWLPIVPAIGILWEF